MSYFYDHIVNKLSWLTPAATPKGKNARNRASQSSYSPHFMRFNTKKPSSTTVNLAGGTAFKETAKLELASILATTFLKDGFYRSADETQSRIIELIDGLKDKKFAAKAALWARTQHGIRSATHLVASHIASVVKGEEWTKDFYSKIVHRPDDALEIMACYLNAHGKPIPNSMKKGIGKALTRFDEYRLAKYRGEGKDLSMVDLVNLVRPKGSEAINKLMKGELKSTETWEAKLSQAGKEEDEESVSVAKGEIWADLIKSNKLGYMALLKNLRNILEQMPEEYIDLVCQQLKDKEKIKKSLVLPFRFISAFEAIDSIRKPYTSKVMTAVAEATEIAMENVPKFDGKTCIMLDASGSMTSAVTRGMPVFQVAALFAAIMAKNNNAEIILFDNNARFANINTADSVYSISKALNNLFSGGGTNLQSAFQLLQQSNSQCDRVVILSDMQSWLHDGKPQVSWNPKIFSFDLAGLGTLQFPEKNVFCLAGWSDKSLGIMKMLDQDQDAMIQEIESILI